MPPDADQFQRGFVTALQLLGWTVQPEAHVTYFDRGSWLKGRIDLVARNGAVTLAAELDNVAPRAKSRAKLLAINCDHRVVVCRQGEIHRHDGTEWQRIESLHDLAAAAPSGTTSEHEPDRPLVLDQAVTREQATAQVLAIIRSAIRVTPDLLHVVAMLEESGVRVLPNVASTTDRFNGFRFDFQGQSFTGAAIGFVPSQFESFGISYDPGRHVTLLRDLKLKQRGSGRV